MQGGFWDAAGLAGIRTPVLFVAGSADDVSGYEKGTRAIFEGAVNADRYLLTFLNANHNAGAPIPAPAETYAYSEAPQLVPFAHYADAVWDTARMNNILAALRDRVLRLAPEGRRRHAARISTWCRTARTASSRWTATASRQPTHTYWKGFKRGTAVGLVLERGTPATIRAVAAEHGTRGRRRGILPSAHPRSDLAGRPAAES